MPITPSRSSAADRTSGSFFTDIDMPGSMNGLPLAVAVRDRWPPIEIIITSGELAPPSGEIPARSVFFPKPYDEEKVIGAMRTFVR